MQISFVMQIFLLFSGQILGGGQKSLIGERLLEGAPPCRLWRKARTSSFLLFICAVFFLMLLNSQETKKSLLHVHKSKENRNLT